MARGNSTSGLSLPEIERLLNRRRRELAKLQKRRATAQRRLDRIDSNIAALGGSAGGRGGAGGRSRARNAMSLQDSIHQVLSKASAPLSVGEILSRVRAAGYTSSSDNFRGIVNQTLLKDKRFAAVKRGIYQLKK